MMARFGLILSLVLVHWAICTTLPVAAVLLRQSHASEKAAALGFSLIQAAIQILPFFFGYVADKASGVRRMIILAMATMILALGVLAGHFTVFGLLLMTLGYSAYKPCMQALMVNTSGGSKAWKYVFLSHNFGAISSALAIGYLNNNALWFALSVICLCVSLKAFVASHADTVLRLEPVAIGTTRALPIASLIAYVIAFAPAHSSFVFAIDEQWIHWHGFDVRIDKSFWIAYNCLVAFISCAVIPAKRGIQRKSLLLGLQLTVLATAAFAVGLALRQLILPMAFIYYTVIGIAEAFIIPSAQAMISEDDASARTAGVVNVCTGLGYFIVMPLQGAVSNAGPSTALLFASVPLLVLVANRLVLLRFRRIA
jgi:MFS family permease